MSHFTTLEQLQRVRRVRQKLKRKRRIKHLIRYTIFFCFLIFLFIQIPPSPKTVVAASVETIKPAIEDLYLKSTINGYTYRWTFVKWDISDFTDSTILSATMGLYLVRLEGAITYEHRQWRVDNQGWTASTDNWELTNYTRDNQEDIVYNDPGEQQYIEFDCTAIITADISDGNSNSTIRIEHPDYLTEYPYTSDNITTVDSVLLDIGRHKTGDYGYIQFSSSDDIEARQPYLTIRTVPPTLTIEYDFPTYSNVTTTIVPIKLWNNTKLLYHFYLHPYEDLTNVSITNIATSYSFAYIFPNASDFEDNISTVGSLTFYNLYETEYEVVLSPSENWHTLHVSLYAPDGLGVMWESFQIYLNDTRIYPPEYELEAGFYTYSIVDYFTQTVKTGNFTIADTDPAHIYQNIEVPVYSVAFHNADLAPYRIEITRNNITREFPSPPKGEAQVRLYGLSTNIPYTITIYQAESGAQIGQPYTLNVPNAPLAQYLNYDDDEGRISFPSYNDQFVAVKQTVVKAVAGQNLLLLLGFGGILLTIIVNRLGLLATIFRKPLFEDRRTK